jgi:uncharacterized sulfatase
MVDAVNKWPEHLDDEVISEAHRLSLQYSVDGEDPENGIAISEVYPPLNFVRAIERRQPELLEAFRCLDERHAIVRQDDNSTYKLIQLDHQPYELFDLPSDALELKNIILQEPDLTEMLNRQLELKESEAQNRRDRMAGDEINLEGNAQLIQRLRGLGYLD